MPEQFLPSILASKEKTSFRLNPRSIPQFQGAVTGLIKSQKGKIIPVADWVPNNEKENGGDYFCS